MTKQPFISGFTIVRNGVKFAYPFIESIRSLLPLCQEFIINLGISDDETQQTLEAFINSLPTAEAQKIQIFQSLWPLDDPEKRRGGQILAEQTNLALQKCRGQWCFYLQADEVLHEDDMSLLRQELEHLAPASDVDALVLNYVHFYGSYDVIQTSRSSYRREMRVIRNHKGIQSIGDAQSFRYSDGSKIPAALSRARVFHYGWVRPPEVMKAKTGFMDTLYHQGAAEDQPATGDNYRYKRFVGLCQFQGSHPLVMQHLTLSASRFDLSQAPRVFHIKDCWKVLSGFIESMSGIRLFEYSNYRLIRKLKDPLT